MLYGEVDRKTGTVRRRRDMPKLERDDGGEVVWLPLVIEVQPAHDPALQRLAETVTVLTDRAVVSWRVESAPPEEVEKRFSTAIQERLDDFARTRRYDNILSACTYAVSTDPKFAAEGQRCVELRDTTWSACYSILDAVLSGARPAPTIAEVFAELPSLTWPE